VTIPAATPGSVLFLGTAAFQASLLAGGALVVPVLAGLSVYVALS
jgi:hypothetical protein